MKTRLPSPLDTSARRFIGTCAFVSLMVAGTPAQAVKFRLPLSSDTSVHYYYDHNTSSGVRAWNCSSTRYDGHSGTDFSGGPRGRAIYAAANGTLNYKIDGFGDGYYGSPDGGGAGNHVRIDHGNGVMTVYMHMTAGSVTGKGIGSGIACSEYLGGVGTSGSSTGLHLHFDLRINGVRSDPYIGSCGGLGYWVNQGNGSPTTACEQPPVVHDQHVVGDWNANGSSGPGAVRKEGANLTWYLKNNNTGGGADIILNYGEATDKPIAGDWDGNGSVTIGVVRKVGDNWTWLLKNSLSAGGADITFNYGIDTDRPIVGDWDGNGTVTAGVIRGTTWLLRNSNSAGSAHITVIYGSSGDKFVAGDWDGDGMFTPGIVRGDMWYLNNNFDSSHDIAPFGFGNSSDEPIVGNWDGTSNSTWTPGVVRDGNNWLLRNTNNGGPADLDFNYGQ